MDWILEGKRIRGTYLDMVEVSGVVYLSRVAYGGRVHHYITLDEPVQVFNRTANSLIIKHNDVLEVTEVQK